jgi:PAS domain S-box-containing protein
MASTGDKYAGASRDELIEEIETLRTREMRFSMIVGLAKDAIVCVDGAERIVLFNRGAEEAFGYDADEVLGQPLAILLPEPSRDSHRAHLEGFRNSGASACFRSERAEIQGRRKDGTTFPAEASISAFTSNDETYFAAVLRDVTERKQHEEAMQQKEAELTRRLLELQDTRNQFEAQAAELVTVCEDVAATRDAAIYANHAKSQFLAHMSHEIRTPLNAILGFSEIIGDELLGPVTPPKYREYAGDIHESGAHLLELINDILDLAKIEAGKLEIQDGEVDVRHAIDASLRFVKERANNAGVALKTGIDAGLPMLRADERMVKQMLINLLTNAVKFTPNGGEVAVLAALDRLGTLRLSVRDTGVGIAAEDIPKVLESFGQADNSRAGVTEGTGLGLPLVKSMIEMHGGTLEIESELDAGTTATICFPSDRLVHCKTKKVA